MSITALRHFSAKQLALAVAMLLIVLAVVVHHIGLPIIVKATVSADSVPTQTISLPFQSDYQNDVDTFTIRLEVWKSPLSSSRLQIHPDDCILSIAINGGPRRNLTRLNAEHRCWPNTYVLNADDDLGTGPNSIEIAVQNAGGPYGINATPIQERRRLAPVVLPMVYLVLFIALPWLIPERWSWPWRSWEAQDHRRLSRRYGPPSFAAFAAFPLAHAAVLFGATSSWMSGLNPDNLVNSRFLSNLVIGTLYHLPLVTLAWTLCLKSRSTPHVRMQKGSAFATAVFAIGAILTSLWKIQDWPAVLRIAATCATLTCILPWEAIWLRLRRRWQFVLVTLIALAPAYIHVIADMVWRLTWELQSRILSNALSLYGVTHEIVARTGQSGRFGHGVLFQTDHWRMFLVERCAIHWLYCLYAALLCSAWMAFQEHSRATVKAIACAVAGSAFIVWANAIRMARTFAHAEALYSIQPVSPRISSLITRFHQDDGWHAHYALVAAVCLMALCAAYWMRRGQRRSYEKSVTAAHNE